MNTREKFEQLYSIILKNNAEDLELSRNKAKKETIRNYIIITLMVVVGFILHFILYKKFYPNDEIVAYSAPLYIFVCYGIYFKITESDKKTKISEYTDIFKSKIVKSLLDSFGERINYYPHNGISLFSYHEAEFEKYDTYSSEDLMQGTLKNNCNFSMAEVLTERITKDTDGDTHHHTLFCGIFSVVETPKPFNACLYLRQDKKDKNILTKVFQFKLPFDKLRVELDSQEFEKIFDVYCSDKIIAMQLLTSDVMQLLLDFQKEMNMDYEITIKNNHIYIRFMSGEMFETANVLKFSLNKDTLYKYYRMLDFIFTLTDKLINLIKDTEYDNKEELK